MIIHSPVLLQETLSFVPKHAKLIFDGTLGHGGHSLAFLQQFPNAKVIGVDVDEKMLEKAELRIKSSTLIGSPSFSKGGKTMFLRASYADIDTVLQ